MSFSAAIRNDGTLLLVHTHQSSTQMNTDHLTRRDALAAACIAHFRNESELRRVAAKAVQLADMLIEELDKTAPTSPPPALPEGVAPPPGDFVFYGMGPLKATGEAPCRYDIAVWFHNKWDTTGWSGASSVPYALRRGSEIARENGIQD